MGTRSTVPLLNKNRAELMRVNAGDHVDLELNCNFYRTWAPFIYIYFFFPKNKT
jgi:hypothetical protein